MANERDVNGWDDLASDRRFPARGALVEVRIYSVPLPEGEIPRTMSCSDKLLGPSETSKKSVRRKPRFRSPELTPRQEQAFRLIHGRGLTLRQAANEMGCTAQNVGELRRKAEAKVEAGRSRSISSTKTIRLPTDADGQAMVGDGTTGQIRSPHTRRKS